ncbi:hypothetical protein HQ520_17530 [bacterium]|nr:hypothetical protein [bacterium]
MKNLDQIRAANALKAAATIGKGAKGSDSVAKKVPTMIRENGILGAAAFALETGQGDGDVFVAVTTHLRQVERIPATVVSLELFLEHLVGTDATHLRAITAESMAYLNYLRRFAGSRNGGR